MGGNGPRSYHATPSNGAKKYRIGRKLGNHENLADSGSGGQWGKTWEDD